MQALLHALLIGSMALTFASLASGAPIVLDPGPGTDYLGVWCGGQNVNEYAQGFDADDNAVATVEVTTSCHGSGRGSPNHYYIACWAVTFLPDGSILSRTLINSGQWTQGHPAVSCDASIDPAAVFVSEGGQGEVFANLSTALTGTVYRAVLETLVETITIVTPRDGAVHALNQSVQARYACSDPDGVFSCSGPVPDGSPIDTSSLGSHVFTVAAQDSLGNAASLTHTYQVATECSDGSDDDGDGLIDFDGGASANHGVPLGLPDPGCLDASSNSTESPACQNGIDDDGDGGIDFDGGASANDGVPLGPPDAQCTHPYRQSERPTCGLGAELALVMPLLGLAASRRRVRRTACGLGVRFRHPDTRI